MEGSEQPSRLNDAAHSTEWLDRALVRFLLRRLLLSIIVGMLLLGTGMALVGFRRTALLSGISVAIAAGLLWIERRGYARSVSFIATVALLAVAAYAMASSNGLNDSSIVVMPGALILSTVLLGPRWIPATILLVTVAVTAVGVAEMQGVIHTPTASVRHWGEITEVLALLWLEGAMIYFLVNVLGQALSEARSAHEETRQIFNATNEAIFIHDATTGKVLDVNETTLSMYGARREEILRSTVRDLSAGVPPYDEEHAAAHLRRAVEEGPQAFEWQARRIDGELFWTEVTLRHATIAGKPRVLAVVRDVSERRRLEQRVRDAEKLTAIGQLAGGVAHDFNNQLVAILGNAELLREQLRDNPRLYVLTESIIGGGARAADLTRQLLAFARKGSQREVPVDLHGIIDEVVTLVERSFDKRITIELRLEAESSMVLGDPSALQNALLNLALNARDAMPQGGSLRFETEDADGSESGCRIRLRVTDTGQGMPADVARRVFEPFFTTKETGTGMGLAAVYGTVRGHGGSIDVSTREGEGTTFTIVLSCTDRTPEPVTSPPATPTRPARGRVLVVDDEPQVARVAQQALEQAGLEADVCTSGRDALRRFEPGRYHLVVLDLAMPDLDGVEVLHRLRQRDPTVHVLLMTGHASESVQARLKTVQRVRIISKPFPLADLVQAAHDAHDTN